MPRLTDHTDIQATCLEQYKEYSNPAQHKFVLVRVRYKLSGKDAQGALILERSIQPPTSHERSLSDSDLGTIQSVQSALHASSKTEEACDTDRTDWEDRDGMVPRSESDIDRSWEVGGWMPRSRMRAP
ncbi:hypothetical protein PLICRDRAFT_179034 [Plicaturopsis crispa FD-325 SS-3]|uniref:Uncharacterized protein n=1 Tax=Plicaturopsis crispa FD-325 SS-3 TaxID=944288 RepID=A0A0C9SYX2_PLICR|nr:hypothetical protein PLICRDRAFT_179034 [Plicaturopsis crispa FD-325 SS-3]